mmetsp:Transcript_37144/g.54494  ORF Transcript_37144/g.54494 Transcript_37144/m.54494 type:complete len:85 (-) Transcript_37144:52-306(-)
MSHLTVRNQFPQSTRSYAWATGALHRDIEASSIAPACNSMHEPSHYIAIPSTNSNQLTDADFSSKTPPHLRHFLHTQRQPTTLR